MLTWVHTDMGIFSFRVKTGSGQTGTPRSPYVLTLGGGNTMGDLPPPLVSLSEVPNQLTKRIFFPSVLIPRTSLVQREGGGAEGFAGWGLNKQGCFQTHWFVPQLPFSDTYSFLQRKVHSLVQMPPSQRGDTLHENLVCLGSPLHPVSKQVFSNACFVWGAPALGSWVPGRPSRSSRSAADFTGRSGRRALPSAVQPNTSRVGG